MVLTVFVIPQVTLLNLLARLVDVYADVPELVNHLHLPVQSGSDRILNLMKRNHMAIEFKKTVRELRKVRPNIAMSSDFIIGFPGESDDDFQDTMKLIEDVNFDMSFSFIYSARPGTPAADLPDDVSMDTKKQRLALLQHRINQQALIHARHMVNTEQRILVEGPSKKNPWNFVVVLKTTVWLTLLVLILSLVDLLM